VREIIRSLSLSAPIDFRQLPQRKNANCHNEKAPTATTKKRQLPQRKSANCHNENAPTATTKMRQLPQYGGKITRFNDYMVLIYN